MQITILSDQGSWKNAAIAGLRQKLRSKGHQVACLHNAESVKRGDILFILGFFKIVSPDVLKLNKSNVVVHESALPKGRGWSPVTWLVLEGAKEIPLTLFEAVDKVDAGKIYLRGKVMLSGSELLPEIHVKVASALMRLCEIFVNGYPRIIQRGIKQQGKGSYYPRRNAKDSRLDPKKTLASQFNLLRTVNNDSYPAYFSHKGSTYLLKIEKKNS